MAVLSVPTLVMDSITKLAADAAGSVAVAGSHGGVYAAYLAARGKLRGVILNDAGIGLEEAGIAGLGYLDALAIAAATVDYRTARIGDGADMIARGTISRVNRAAAALGCTVGERCPASAERMRRAELSSREPPPYEEGRFLLRHQRGGPEVWGLDSNSLAEPSDTGAVLVTGSHGGLLGGKPESAIAVAARAAVYNDAGIGIDRAGVSRLPVLAARGIVAATVAAATARIGEARSTWATGRLSDMNELARSLGAEIGMSVPELVDLVLRHARARGRP
ncbi:MAG TPA: hypothetical protein VEK12_06275 [Alphaproteobacteria bacterium]|nr:hypothetical protein [Alphaproteobacteria bacterium]